MGVINQLRGAFGYQTHWCLTIFLCKYKYRSCSGWNAESACTLIVFVWFDGKSMHSASRFFDRISRINLNLNLMKEPSDARASVVRPVQEQGSGIRTHFRQSTISKREAFLWTRARDFIPWGLRWFRSKPVQDQRSHIGTAADSNARI
jgi:hypothetical protein